MQLTSPLTPCSKGRSLKTTTMKRSLDLVARCVIGIGACQGASAAAAKNVDPQEDCYWATGAGLKSFRHDVGTLYIPRDAKVGSVIGAINDISRIHDPAGLEVRCLSSSGNTVFEWNAKASVPVFPGPLDPVDGEDLTGKVLQTNIQGVGARIRQGYPFDGRATNAFWPAVGLATVPFQGFTNGAPMLTPVRFSAMNSYITLIKTGPIPAGPQQLDGRELFYGTVTTLGRVLSFGLTGTVIPAQCTVGGSPVSADPVQLGEWESADFTGPGFTTTAVPFSITLSNCETDTAPGFVATANIQLDGVRGSMPVAPTSSGVFSLTTDSDAQGVGIQILKADGVTPMELQTQVPVMTITPGNTVLNFNARFYQTAASSAVRPGIAKGALSFTITYK
jgi:type 1 fimbria pilin